MFTAACNHRSDATDFYGAYIPCANRSPLITRWQIITRAPSPGWRDDEPADAIIFSSCSASSTGGLTGKSRGLAKRKREETRERAGTRSQGTQRG